MHVFELVIRDWIGLGGLAEPLSLVPGAWCLVPGAWCLVLGAWCLVLGYSVGLPPGAGWQGACGGRAKTRTPHPTLSPTLGRGSSCACLGLFRLLSPVSRTPPSGRAPKRVSDTQTTGGTRSRRVVSVTRANDGSCRTGRDVLPRRATVRLTARGKAPDQSAARSWTVWIFPGFRGRFHPQP